MRFIKQLCMQVLIGLVLAVVLGIVAPGTAVAVKPLGERGVVELVGLLGYDTLVAMTLNAFEIGLPAGEVSDLPE